MDDNETQAIQDLLVYLENVRLLSPPCSEGLGMGVGLCMELIAQQADREFFDSDVLRSLSTLVYSNRIQLQRTAALAFAEITEKGMTLSQCD